MSTVERNVYCASYSLPYSGNESLVNAMHKSKNLYNATLWDCLRQRYLTIFSNSDILANTWYIDLRDETARDDLSIRQWTDLHRIIEQKYLHGLAGVICSSNDTDIIDHSRVLGNVPAMVNYAPPKGGELVMLPMLPWQAYSTIGWLTDTLPSRFSECRLEAS